MTHDEQNVGTPVIRQAVVTESGEVILRERPRPEPALGEARVEPLVVGLCGSDVHAKAGQHPWMNRPYVPGHEVVGRIVELGPHSDGLTVGQRVIVEPTLPCWECKQCVGGRENLCERLRFFGCGADQGGIADSFTVPVDRLHPIPDSMSDLDAALIEPLATPVHAVRLAIGEDTLAGRTVAVIGGGTIGQFVAAAAEERGADRLVVIDPMLAKRELAIRRGALAAIDPGTGDVARTVRGIFGESVDLIFDCVGTQTTLAQGLAMADRGGQVVIVGVPTADVSVALKLVQDRQIRVQGAATYLPPDFHEATEMVAKGAVDAATFVSAEYPLDQLANAFSAAADPETIKVVIRMQSESLSLGGNA